MTQNLLGHGVDFLKQYTQPKNIPVKEKFLTDGFCYKNVTLFSACNAYLFHRHMNRFIHTQTFSSAFTGNHASPYSDFPLNAFSFCILFLQ